MRPIRVLALAGLSTTLLGTANAEIESEFHAGWSSDYIFRGQDFGPNLFEFGLDFAGSGDLGSLGALDWSAGIWYGTFGTGGTSNNELDIYGEVSKSLNDMFSVAVGITNYSYFGQGVNAANLRDDIEPYVALGAELGETGLSVGAALYWEIGSSAIGPPPTSDLYYEFTLAYERELMENVSGGIELLLGVFDDPVVVGQTDSTVYFGGTASISVSVTEDVTVSPFLSATFSDDLPDNFYGGVSVGFGF